MDEMDALDRATTRYRITEEEHEKARLAAIDAVVAALKKGHSPTDVANRSPFTAAYVRRFARQHGIKPAAPGPKKVAAAIKEAGAAARRAEEQTRHLAAQISQED